MESPPILIYRVSNFFYRIKLRPISTLLNWTNRFLFATFIPGSAKIGKNFKVGYWGLGVVIHKNCKIGNDCTIGQNVTIGRNFGQKGVPKIGNSVYISTGSVIFGEINIGDNVIIGSNSLVNKSVPSNSIVGGNPLRVIKTNSPNYLQINNK